MFQQILLKRNLLMKIEDEIKMKKFESPQMKAMLNILFTSNWLSDLSKKAMKPFGLTSQQFNVLRILRGRHPEFCSAQEVKAVMIDKSPDLTRLIDRLLQKGLVTRMVCEENRRKVDIGITDDGLELLKEMDPVVRANNDSIIDITDKEAEELSRILDKLRG